jgi:hypothetical protein
LKTTTSCLSSRKSPEHPGCERLSRKLSGTVQHHWKLSPMVEKKDDDFSSDDKKKR